MPPKALSQNAIVKRKRAGLPLTQEELDRYKAFLQKCNANHIKWLQKRKANEPSAIKMPTQNEVMERYKACGELTPLEQIIFRRYWETPVHEPQVAEKVV